VSARVPVLLAIDLHLLAVIAVQFKDQVDRVDEPVLVLVRMSGVLISFGGKDAVGKCQIVVEDIAEIATASRFGCAL
jgi:uncharacterized 2Fe-2S/4Fe-4S cluster protein (DUF4445 family)